MKQILFSIAFLSSLCIVQNQLRASQISKQDANLIQQLQLQSSLSIRIEQQSSTEEQEKKDYALLTAVQKGNWINVKIALAAGADINTQIHSLQRTPLHLAIDRNFSDIFEMLIDAGADIGKEDFMGWSVCSYAMSKRPYLNNRIRDKLEVALKNKTVTEKA